MLAERVAKGELPPVEERLPENPYAITGLDGIGNFGGAMRQAFSGQADGGTFSNNTQRGLLKINHELALINTAAESWELTPDGKTFTFHLRKGMKWSDGMPFTSEAMKWRWDNEFMNKDITPGGVSSPFATGKEKTPMVMETPDDYTVVCKFAAPNPLYFIVMGGRADRWVPVHYVKHFHMAFTEDKAKLEKEYKDLGLNNWQAYYAEKIAFHLNPDLPRVGAWLAKNKLSEEMFIMERNPYFFGVDEEGQQLPYIDKLTHRLFESNEVLNLWVTNGEIDMQYRHMQEANLPLYKQGEAQGDYKVVLGVLASHVGMQLNLTVKKPQLAEFFNDRNVRIALSHACNREEVNELVYNGLLKPRQYSPLPMSPQYYEKLSNAYLEYDPDKANQLLDEAGYDKKGPDGIRLFKDGSGPISFVLEGIEQAGSQLEDTFGLISGYFEKVGVKMAYKYVERALYTEHYNANDLDGGTWGGDRTVLPLVPEAIIFRGVQPDRPWCPGWWRYYTEPDNPTAVKPPDGHWIWEIWRIWDEEVVVEPDPAKQTEAFKKLLDIWATELPMITLLGERPAVSIVKNGFKGYPAGMPNDDTTGDEHFCQDETYYWDDPAKHTV